METNDGLRIVSDNRVNATANAEREAADALPVGSPEKAKALVRMKHAELAARNVPGGFWVAAADPSVVNQALTGEIPLKTVRRAVLLTDGATRAVIPFRIYGWPSLLSAVIMDGPKELIRQVRIAEDADPSGIRQPRNKIHDDATVAVIQFSERAGLGSEAGLTFYCALMLHQKATPARYLPIRSRAKRAGLRPEVLLL